MVGRPTDYKPELVKKAWDYIETYEEKYNDKIPSVAGLCSALNINRSTAYDWAKDEDKEFSDILEKIASEQEKKLVNSGLSGDFNSTITKLMLTKHGYSDKQEIENKVAISSIEIPVFTDAPNG